MINDTNPRLQINKLSVAYAEQPILKNINLNIPNGKITALIGANGCGKSTLMKTIARVLSPTQGEILLDGKSVHHLPTKQLAKKFAFLPQNPLPPEGLTVRELVAQGRFPHQSIIQQWSSNDHNIVHQAMLAADIVNLADRAVLSLSGGQRQRVWIAMILAQQTDILLLDEPTTFLDMKVQIDVLNLLTRITHQSSRTLVVVLHELNMASAFADYIVMMKAGKIVATGTPNEIFTSEYLSEVFDLKATIIRDPYHKRPVCLPIFYH